MGRRLRSHLDLLHPDIGKKVEERQQKQISSTSNRVTRIFKVGDKVFARVFRSNKLKWLPGEIVNVSGPSSYHVKIAQGVIRRHVNSLRRCYSNQADQMDTESSYRDDLELLQPTVHQIWTHHHHHLVLSQKIVILVLGDPFVIVIHQTDFNDLFTINQGTELIT